MDFSKDKIAKFEFYNPEYDLCGIFYFKYIPDFGVQKSD